MMTLQNHVRQQPGGGAMMMMTLQNAMRPQPGQSMFSSVKLEPSEQQFVQSEGFQSLTASGGYDSISDGENIIAIYFCWKWRALLLEIKSFLIGR